MPDITADTYIVDGNITVFLGQHSETFKQDILYSSLLGSLVSNAHDIASNTWINNYQKTLGNLFWTTQRISTESPGAQSASILTFVEPILARHTSKAEIQRVIDAFDTVKKLPEDSEALIALSNRIQRSHDSPPSVNTVCPLLTVVSANKEVISVAVAFDTDLPVGIAILDEALPEKEIISTPQVSQWITYLSEKKYAAVRDKIIEKLGSKISTHLHHLTPPEGPVLWEE